GTGNSQITGVAPNQIFNGEWNHVALSWESSTGETNVYINGVLESTFTFRQGTSIDQGGRMMLGQEQDSVGGGFANDQKLIGDIDEFAFFDRPLNAGEISDQYAASIQLFAANDTDIDNGDKISVASVTAASASGAVVTLVDGIVSYDVTSVATIQALSQGETATDSFSYTITDGNGGTATATVSINLTGVNDPVTAVADTGTTNENAATNIDVIGNDQDVDANDVHSVIAIDDTGAAGTVTNNGTSVTYDPAGQFDALSVGGSATDSFTYTVSDGEGSMSVGSVVVTINGLNDPVDAFDDSATTDEDNPVTFNVLSNDVDPDAADVIAVTAFDAAGVVGLVSRVDGDFTYDPNGQFESLAAGQSTTEQFTYTVTDGQTSTDVAIVTVTIDGVNDAPVAAAGTVVQIAEGDDLVLDASGSSDIDDGDVLSFAWDLDDDGVYDDAIGAAPTVTWAELIAIGVADGLNPLVALGIAVQVTDLAGATDVAATTLEISNVAPTGAINGETAIDPALTEWTTNRPITFTFTAADPAAADEAAGFTYLINWGDGSSEPATNYPPSGVALTHEYENFGSYAVSLTVTDKDDGTDTQTHDLEIVPVLKIDDDIVAGGTDDVDDRIVFSIVSQGRILVRYNSDVYGPFDATPATRLLVTGGAGNDRVTITGNTRYEAVLEGNDGNDNLLGGQQDDTILGGPGRDIIQTGEGNNYVDGGDGNDWITSRSGDDDLYGGAGNDTISGGAGVDVIDGQEGNDRITGGGGGDLLIGGLGNDNIVGESGRDVIIGGLGNDSLRGGDDEDFLAGGAGLDAVLGERAVDVLVGANIAIEGDEAQLRTLLLDWTVSTNSTAAGAFTDDGERDGLNGGGGADIVYTAADDNVFLRSNDSEILL
ncbi:MAG: VCBS repeat-containing protein, partial [Pirellulaceae bacterium]